MFCAISGEVPQEPVISVKTGHLFERRLIEKYLKVGNKCPISGVELAETDLLSVQGNKAVKPRALVNTSIPGILSTLQNEWDEAMLETFTLKTHLDATRQELSQALYQQDAGCRVIARLMRERDEARAMLASASANMTVLQQPTATPATQPMTLAPTLPPSEDLLSPSVIAAISDKCKELSSSRKGRTKALEAAGSIVTSEEIASWTALRSFTSHRSDKGQVHCVAVASGAVGQPDMLLTGGSDNSALVVNSETGAIISKLTGHSKKITAISSFPSKSDPSSNLRIFTGSADKTVKLWTQSESESAPTPKKGAKSKAADKDAASVSFNQLSTFNFHTADVTALSVHPTGNYLLSMSKDGSWCFVDVPASACLRKVHSNATAQTAETADVELLCGQLHPDGLILGTGTSSGIVKIWDIREQKCVAEFAPSAEETGAGGVLCVAFSENGYLLGSGAEGGGAKIWDLRKLKCVKTLESGGGVVSSLSFDHTAAFLALGTSEGTLRVTTVKDWMDVSVLSGLHSKSITGIAWGGQKAGAQPKSAFLATCSLDRAAKVIGISSQ